jgi:hypothetical protein
MVEQWFKPNDKGTSPFNDLYLEEVNIPDMRRCKKYNH